MVLTSVETSFPFFVSSTGMYCCSLLEVDDPETVNTTDISFIALWSDDQGVERVVLFEQLLPCLVLGIKVEESSFAAVAYW